MKKLITVMICCIAMLSLTACNGLPFGEKEPEPFVPVPMSVSGTITDITDNMVTITDETGSLYKIQFETIPEDMHIETAISAETETTEFGEYLTGISYSVTYQPLKYVLGYTGEELVSNKNEYTSTTYQVKEVIGADAMYNGRAVTFNWTNASIMQNNIYTRHTTNVYGSVLDSVRLSSVYEEYVTQKETITKYVNYNFSGWYSESVESYIMEPNMVFSADAIVVSLFEMKDDVNVKVEFTWDYLKDDNILVDYIKATLAKFSVDETSIAINVLAEYNAATKDLQNLTLDITNITEASYEEVPLQVASYQITVYGVEYNKDIIDLEAPENVITTAQDIYYLDNPLPEVPDLITTDLLCKSLMSKEQVMVDDVLEITGYTDDITIMRWGVESRALAKSLKDWLNAYTTETFMHKYVTLDASLSNEELISASIIYSWLQPYDINEQDYRTAPVE